MPWQTCFIVAICPIINHNATQENLILWKQDVHNCNHNYRPGYSRNLSFGRIIKFERKVVPGHLLDAKGSIKHISIDHTIRKIYIFKKCFSNRLEDIYLARQGCTPDSTIDNTAPFKSIASTRVRYLQCITVTIVKVVVCLRWTYRPTNKYNENE